MTKIVLKGKKGKKPIVMEEGGLHKTTGTPKGKKIPASKVKKALAGGYGPKGKKQAVAAQGLLKKGRETAAKKKKR